MTDPIVALSKLPEPVRERLQAMSISKLIDGIERASFECEGGPLINFTEWLELKARIAELSRLIPRSATVQ